MHRERWVRAKRQRALLSKNGMSQLPTGVTGWRQVTVTGRHRRGLRRFSRKRQSESRVPLQEDVNAGA